MSDGDETAGAGAGHILVGIDGSEGSRAACEFALDEAVLRGLTARVVLVYDVPASWVLSLGATVDMAGLRESAREKAAEQIKAVTEARTARGTANPPLEVEVHRGPPGAVLERLSRGAEILVVGHRGRGETASLMIGSVGLNSVIHAHCTVVVVRA
ncbi:universal stress protein [Pseudonocardia parietis]|uniref:Nucleotide-binding universal stress UspA family protein n=1 Tax=Pseudonocardia parietis TaxID=570936 RepID=A0ABS4VW65_9PSEU|nr:universal stress protein [Pseudonocardia parietis]MBP2368170.1 nucleotide-binding universal stress UspA family protein [Pseudonocardia parietis]